MIDRPVGAPSIAPDVSLVVIGFNESLNGPDCIRAILAQEADARFELIFVDDCSTDGTAEAVTAAAAGNPRFRLIRFPDNRGRGAARAAGVEAARGRAIGFVDADITLPQHWLARCLAALPDYAAVGGIAVPDGDATTLARISGAAPREVPGSGQITGNNVLFDAAVLSRIGFDAQDRLGEDTRLSARLMRAGYRLHRIPDLVVRHDENKTYRRTLRWRYENGLDASSLPRELGTIRFADIVWIGWLAAWVVGIVGAMVVSPWWLLSGVVASIGAGVAHAVTRFRPWPMWPFVLACIADVPLLAAYLAGRTVGFPRLLRGRR